MFSRKELVGISEQHRLYVNTNGAKGKKANLSGRDLSGDDLGVLYFNGADFIGADFSGADFSDADFSGANLRCSDFSGADFSDADFNGADLTDAKLDYQIQDGLLKEIAEKVLENVTLLDMEDWHSKCGTIHCIAGWACALNPVAGRLENKIGTANAALLTLGSEAHSHFFDSNEDALKYLKSVLEK